ncbi:hypothetical protein FPANT_9897 [Fusarium pseudoanthophilum]|uniref:Hedgehog/Intein (Hint) domain-containing protein n=1 Tax=Fusarium pseudoanthophilum TaxID=48495 RepID=A0A8H5KU76_9HYPO|nr:hypothetical protein FPANT_9897 [Fusarium pseudoanthophilum]
MSELAPTTAEKLLDALGSLGYLDEAVAATRLQAAFLETSSMATLRPYFFTPEHDQLGMKAKALCVFDEVDRYHEIEQLGNASMAVVMGKIDDPWGFKTLCDANMALGIPDVIFNVLMSSMFAEHINEHLEKQGLQPLNKLQTDKDLIEGFKALVNDDLFDPIGERHDPFYAMNILFVHEYLAKGAGFQLSTNASNVEGKSVFTSWQTRTERREEKASVDDSNNAQLLAKYAYIWSGVFSPFGTASIGISQTAKALLSSGSLDTPVETPMTSYLKNIAADDNSGLNFDSSTINAYKGLSHRIWEKWVEILNDQSRSTFWQQGIRQAQNNAVVSEAGSQDLGLVKINFKTTVHGPELAAWYTQNRTAPYMNANGALNNIAHSKDTQMTPIIGRGSVAYPPGWQPAPVTCFVAGTVIRTNKGDIPIEDLQEGDTVCTRLEPAQWGVRSCEAVQSPSPEVIYGFNNEPGFFTAGHVFHTTTGLRALDPYTARVENPWIEVGQLAIGHQLIRAKDDEKYELVLVETINAEPSKSEFVYGVHLREGLRSYHANGYLVALNYPEITVSMMAKRLVSLKPDDRLRILRSLRELQPIFERFGAATALDVLEHEARSNNLTFGGKPAERHELLTRDIDLPYILTFDDGSEEDTQVELLHGALIIDGSFCEAATFDKLSLAWTRELADGQCEHAHCIFTHNGQSARGYIARVSDCEEDHEIVVSNAKSFRLTPGTLVQASHVEDVLVTENSDPATDPSVQGVVKFPAPGPPFLKMMASDNMMQAESVASLPTSLAVTSRLPLVFSLSYDPSEWSSSAAPAASIRCGNITIPVENNKYSFPKLQIEDFDIVRDALAAKLHSDPAITSQPGSFPTFYEHKVSYDVRQREHHLFELQHPQALLEASDEYRAWKKENSDYLEKEPPSKNLHYTNLGLPDSFQITEIWQTITLEKSLPTRSGVTTLSGVGKVYSMTSDGNEGTPHYIVGTYIRGSKNTPTTAAAMIVSNASTATRDITQAHISPSPVVHALAITTEDDMDAKLQELTDVMYNQSEVNASAQTMMINVMQWHMLDDERKLFFNATDKPKGLPAELTTSIQNTEAAKWIGETYARAYMCQVLSQADGNIRDEFKFTEEEKKSARYFWSGKGKDCLSRSQIYKNLERAVSRYQMRQKYDIIGKIYDSGKGVEYSNELYGWHTEEPEMLRSVASRNPVTGTTSLTKICAIMDALDDGNITEHKVDPELSPEKTVQETNSNMLVFAVNANEKKQLWYKQYWGMKTHDEKTKALEDKWLGHALKDMVQRILDQDPAIKNPVTEALSLELEEFGKKIQGWQKMSTEMKAQQVEILLGDRIPKFMQAVAKTFGWVLQGGKWVLGQVKNLGGWQQNSAALGRAADRIVGDEELLMGEQTTGLLKGPVAKSLLVLVGMFAIGTMIWNFSDRWHDADAIDTGIMVTTVLLGVRQLAEFSLDAVYAILRYKKGVFNEAVELGIYTRFDNMMGRRLGSKWAGIVEGSVTGPGTKVVTLRDLKKAEAGDPLGLFRKQITIGPETPELTVRQSLDRLNEMSKVRKGFNIARRGLAVMGYILSIGLAIFLTWQLFRDWKDMDTGTRWFETIQVVLACIEGLGALIVTGSMIAWGVAAWAGAGAATAIGTFAVAAASIFASFAIVMGALAVIVLVAYLIWQSKQPPPPSPLENWMKGTGKEWLKSHPAPPPPLTVDVTPSSVPYTSDLQTMRLGFTNKTPSAQEIEFIIITFASGSSPGAVFTWTQNFNISDVVSAGNCYLSAPADGSELLVANHPSMMVPTDRNVTLSVKNVDGSSRFTVAPGARLEITMFGSIQSDGGEDCSISWSVGGTEDVTNGTFIVKRAKKP